jgi:Spermidine synthase
MIHLMEVNDPSFESVFVIGHGIGTIASHYSDKLFKIAEIDERVVELSRQYFSYRLSNVIIGDGRRILEEEEPDTYDYILLDAFSFKGTPLHLITREFFDLTATKLRNRGAVILNCMGKIKNDRLIAAIHTTLREVYAYTKAFFLPEADGAAAGNVIIVGSFQPIDFQARNMAEFKECEIEEGHLIRDSVY